jgi:hypothetical protein
MSTFTFTVEIKVVVETDLSIEDAIDQFQTETDYDFTETDNIKVIETELLEVR